MKNTSFNPILDKIRISLHCKKRVNGESAPLREINRNVVDDLANLGYVLDEEYISQGMMKMYNNYVFKKGEGTIFIGIGKNTYKEVGEGFKKISIEYNPQKIEFPLLLKDYLLRAGYVYDMVEKCDCAIDFVGKSLDDFRLNTKRKIMVVGQPNNLTRYIAPQDQHGRIKIYDKTKERRRLGINIPQTVRVEMTLKKPCFHENFIIENTDFLYLQEVEQRFNEVLVSSSFPRLQDNVLPYVLYLLEKANDIDRAAAFSLMQPTTASKYRKAFNEATFEPLTFSIMEFAQKMSVQINQSICDCTIPYF